MVLKDIVFIAKILPGAILRTLSAKEMAQFRRPFAEPGVRGARMLLRRE